MSWRFRTNAIAKRLASTRYLATLVTVALILMGSVIEHQAVWAVQNAPSLTPIATNTPHVAIADTAVPMPTVTATAAMVFIATPAPGPLGGSDSATWTPAALSLLPNPHFWLSRPIGEGGVNYIAHNYAYGGTDNNGRPPHHGDDYENPSGTPVLAAGDGVVQYAGDDIQQLFGPQPNFYGNVIVIRHPFADSNGQAVFSLYGHLSQIAVQTGQSVKVGQVIGQVGSAGVAVGAHLHFEVRAGDPNNYNSTRNPELWVAPFSSMGAAAGRVTNLYGQPVGTIQIQFQHQDSFYAAENYADNGTPGDTQWQETFALSDLPNGYYTVFIRSKDGAILYRNTTLIVARQITWLGDIHIPVP